MDSRVEKMKKGQRFIKVSKAEMIFALNGLAICDSCSIPMENGYLIPVLNSAYCEKCFKKYEDRAEFYQEDVAYETEKTKIYLKALKANK